MSTVRRRREWRYDEPTALQARGEAEFDAFLDRHFALVDAEEALLAHLAAWQQGEARLKVGMHGAVCLRDASDDCLCTGQEVTVFVQDPADRLDDGPVCDNPRWAEVER